MVPFFCVENADGLEFRCASAPGYAFVRSRWVDFTGVLYCFDLDCAYGESYIHGRLVPETV